MTRALRWLYNELTKPRGHVRHRFYRVGRSSKSGIAMLLTITTLLFMTVLVAEIQYAATVRLKLAAHQRDEAKAEVLAKSGVYMYQLVLVASKQVSGQMQQMASFLPPEVAGMLGGMELWELLPFVNTGLMRAVFVSGGDLDDLDSADDSDGGFMSGLFGGGGDGGGQVATVQLSEEERAKSRDNKSSRAKSFLDFDGDFYVEVTDEDRRINVKEFHRTQSLADLSADGVAGRLRALMWGQNYCEAVQRQITDAPLTTVEFTLGPVDQEEVEDHEKYFRDRDIDPWELIANLADWTDADDIRAYQGGNEDSLYDKLEPPYRAKNAGFDSLEEIRLVDGWNDDEIWERYGRHLTVYGSGKVNVNTADCEVIWALLTAKVEPYDPAIVGHIWANLQFQKSMFGARYQDAGQFINEVKRLAEEKGATVSPGIGNHVTTESTVFRVHSVGEVGDASVTIDAIFDFSQSATGKVIYWRVQ